MFSRSLDARDLTFHFLFFKIGLSLRSILLFAAKYANSGVNRGDSFIVQQNKIFNQIY